MYDGRLTPELAATTFRNIDRLVPVRVVHRGAHVSPLPISAAPLGAVTVNSKGARHSLSDYTQQNRVSGLLVLKDGEIVLEQYALGAAPQTRWMSMSMAKSITATLIGVALHEGKISSIDDPVTKYVPSLGGSAYDGVTVRNILMMASGVRWNETYTDSASDRRHLLEAQLSQRAGSALRLMAQLPRAAAPGSILNYSTGETLVAGEVLRGAVGKPIAQYLSEKVWQPAGMESDASWWLDSPDGHEIAGSGLSATLRDFGRFGLLALNGGVVNGHRIVDATWMAEAGSAKRLSGGRLEQYGYMWWPMAVQPGSIHEGAFSAQGIFGQWIYVNPKERVVIVQLAAQTHPSAGEVVSTEDFFAAVARAARR